jgi:predicted RNA-binding protein YlqC (UPF0109 family)
MPRSAVSRGVVDIIVAPEEMPQRLTHYFSPPRERTQKTELVTQIVQSLVDRPQEVRVKTIQSDHTMVLELRVAKDDIGKVIGKQGRTAQAMRTLLDVVSAKIKKRTVLEIVE